MRSLGGAGVVAALALGSACSGPDAISIGSTSASSASDAYYLSPDGKDTNSGLTPDAPWLTFARALPALRPGSTLKLLDGTYTRATTGYLNVRCDGPAPNAVVAQNGAMGMPIIVQAVNPRQAFLSGDGSRPPLTIDACASWSFIGLHVESADLATAADTLDNGSVIVVGFDNTQLTFEGLLARRPNRYLHSHVLRVGDGSSFITVEDSELYDFHHNAIEAWRTDNLKLLRNYINSRGTADLPNGYVSEAPNIGDWGIFLEETRDSVVANNVVESVNDGIGLVGRYVDAVVMSTHISNVIDGNELLGNIVYRPVDVGVRLDSRCLMPGTTTPETPCADTFLTIKGTTLSNDVVVGGDEGISSAGAIGTIVNEVSVINAANGVIIHLEPQNVGLISTSSSTTTNSLVANYQAVGFDSEGEASSSFDHCATSGGYNPTMEDYVPGGNVSNAITVAPGLGTCLAYLPSTSPLKGAGVGASGVPTDVGANVVDRYADDGTLSQQPLWSPTGGFPCGPTVTGVNADPATSCAGVGTRLDVGPTASCPLPSP